MKHRLLIHLPIFFLIGVVLSYAVAWGCAIVFWTESGFPHNSDVLAEIEPYEMMDIFIAENIGSTRVSYMMFQGRFKPLSDLIQDDTRVCRITGYNPYEEDIEFGDRPLGLKLMLKPELSGSNRMFTAGWPFRCVYVSSRVVLHSKKRDYGEAIRFELDGYHVELPYRPFIDGLILDTLLYGLMAYGFWLIPGPLKRRRRVRKGLCPKCKYDLRGDHGAGCPECGWGRQLDAAKVSET